MYGSSMGGARPKTLLTHNQTDYLVKFNKPDDLYNVARVEHAAMRMLDELAELMRQHSTVASDAHQLFQRMVFNVLIGNTDDHARNHAWLYALPAAQEQRGWRLAPAYDVLPISATRQHALGIGDAGRMGSKENLLSQASRFGLQDFKARQLFNRVRDLVNEWASYFAQQGVHESDIERLGKIIPKIV